MYYSVRIGYYASSVVDLPMLFKTFEDAAEWLGQFDAPIREIVNRETGTKTDFFGRTVAPIVRWA